ncbi:MAG TPA: dTDP-4-dehydrorhamnose reductase [Acidimicrobiales bacterium]
MSARVLVTGAGGQVGQDLLDTLAGQSPRGGDPAFLPDGVAVRAGEFEVAGLTRSELDVTDRDATRRVFAEVSPDVVVHLAAYTAVDRAEGDPAACYAVNEEGTANVSDAAREFGAHLIAISTDYVFDGTKGATYLEDDATNPLNVYGASKRAGELRCAPEDTIVRTSWVMGVRGTSVVHVIAERAERGESVRFVNDQRGTVTTASDLARALVSLVRTRPGGLWHVANAGETTWFDIAAYVGEVLGRGEDFASPIASSELSGSQVALRPANSGLNTAKFSAAFSALPEWRVALARLVRERVRAGGES